MSDPLGLITSAGGTGGLRPLEPVREAGSGVQGVDPGAPSFKDVLLDNINQVNKLQQEATTAMQDLATGKRTDLEGVILATQKADTAFHLLLALRNKMQAAYEEIKQMRT